MYLCYFLIHCRLDIAIILTSSSSFACSGWFIQCGYLYFRLDYARICEVFRGFLTLIQTLFILVVIILGTMMKRKRSLVGFVRTLLAVSMFKISYVLVSYMAGFGLEYF